MPPQADNAARNPYDGGNKPCASSEPHEPHTWTLAAIDGNYYDCPGVPEPPAATSYDVARLTIRQAFDLRYHVPRSQVWEGSAGKQRGNIHLYVKRGEAFQAGRIRRVQHQTLCGRTAWYDRALEAGEGERAEDFCPRCIEIGTREIGFVTGLVA